jgi:hypothetical protein
MGFCGTACCALKLQHEERRLAALNYSFDLKSAAVFRHRDRAVSLNSRLLYR